MKSYPSSCISVIRARVKKENITRRSNDYSSVKKSSKLHGSIESVIAVGDWFLSSKRGALGQILIAESSPRAKSEEGEGKESTMGGHLGRNWPVPTHLKALPRS